MKDDIECDEFGVKPLKYERYLPVMDDEEDVYENDGYAYEVFIILWIILWIIL